ncbi:MerR family transcriptional regulator [Streptococcus sp. X16XC17]|uniref:MerR family transcriptional regulator n=1 Tax=unclassified Streptococcus TaxID=2608887 RepID=UPI00066FBC8F|nr:MULTISPECIES: MerR family transcriptional regulator [unclassified Streptococcus]TCD45540.1 MerR family transcriptional regulator [Streptococcus sp. X16XC17]
MREKELRRTLSVFPIGSVMKLTDLTARQIRYYEEQGLIEPDRNEGNRRMYSLNDMDRLLEIKDYLADGYNIAAIKSEYAAKGKAKQKSLSDSQVRQLLHDELSKVGRFTTAPNGFDTFRMK